MPSRQRRTSPNRKRLSCQANVCRVVHRGSVFSDDWIDAYLELKMDEVNKVRMTTHPVDFELYYIC